MPNAKITGLPANTGLANDTLFEDVKDPSGLTLSQKVRLDEISAFLLGNLASLSIAGGKILLNADGSVSFSTAGFTVDAGGNVVAAAISVAGNQMFVDSGGNLTTQFFSSVNGGQFGSANQLQIDSSGNITLGTNGVINGLFLTTLDTTSPATFNTTGQHETIYDNSGSVVANLTINLPATSVTGQILRYVSKAGATIVTVTGTVSIGTALTTLAANSSVAWQAVNTTGTFIRIQ